MSLNLIKFGTWFLHGTVTSNPFETVSTCIPIMAPAFGLPTARIGIITSTCIRNIELTNVITQVILLVLGIKHRIIANGMLLSNLITSILLVIHSLLCDGETGEYLLYVLMFPVGIIEALSMLASVSWRSDVTTAIMTGFNFSGLPQRLYQQITLGTIDTSSKSSMRSLLVKLWAFNLFVVVIYIALMIYDIYFLIPNPNPHYKPFGDFKKLKETFMHLYYVKYPIILFILMEAGFYLFYPSIVIFSVDSYTKENYEWRSTLLNLIQSTVILVLSTVFLLWDIFDPKCMQRDGFPAYKNHMQFLNSKNNYMWLVIVVLLLLLRSFFGLSIMFSYAHPNDPFLNYLKTYKNLFPIVVFMGITRAYGSIFSSGNCYGLMFQKLMIRNITNPNNQFMETIENLKTSIDNKEVDEKYSEIFGDAKIAIHNAIVNYNFVLKDNTEGNNIELTQCTTELHESLNKIISLEESYSSYDNEVENGISIQDTFNIVKKFNDTLNSVIDISSKSTQLMIFLMTYGLLYFTEFQSRFLKTHFELTQARSKGGSHYTDKYGSFRTFWWWFYRVPVISSIRLIWPFYTS